MTAQVVPLGKAAPTMVVSGGPGGAKHQSKEAHVQYWMGADIPREIQGSKLIDAFRIWQAASANGIPRLREITNSKEAGTANDTMLLLKMNDDYLVVAQGANYIHTLGRDLRGLLISEFKKPSTVVMKELYDICLAQGQAIYTRFVSDLSRQGLYWEGLLVPLRADEGRQPIFVKNYMIPIDDRADTLQLILDSSPVGMLAAIPFGGDEGNVQDGRIIIVNARAKEILKFDDSSSHIHYIRDLTPWLADKLGWNKISMTTDKLQTRVQYRDGSNRTYLVTIEALMRFVLFSIFEIKDGALSRSTQK